MSQKKIESLLQDKRFKPHHYNTGDVIDWCSSTGSLSLDMFLDGGLSPGIIRLSGEPESGKTSFALNCAKIFQESIKDSFVFYVNAEGRLNKTLLERTGISTKKDKWFCFDSNMLEPSLGMIKELITDNPDGKKYLFILDSSDALCRMEDLNKEFQQGQKVAGSAVTFSFAGKALSLPVTRFGHAMMVLSQTRTKMNTMGYGGGGGSTVSGGKALGFYSSTMAEIQALWTDLYIWENPTAPSIKDKGKRLGHYCVMRFTKTRNEKTGQEVAIPVKYSQKGGAIWKEVEIYMLCLQWEMIKKSGAWFTFSDSLVAEAEEAGIKIIQKHQGERKVWNYLADNPDLLEFLEKKFSQLI
jgi:recombination protein RecA